MHRRIRVTNWDSRRLRSLLQAKQAVERFDPNTLQTLRRALESAIVLLPPYIPPTTITMHSMFRLTDVDTSQELRYTLVFPGETSGNDGLLSVLAPLGAGLFGHERGEVVPCAAPGGITRVRIEDIIYQPEAVGDYLS